jgi:hypothetical protein
VIDEDNAAQNASVINAGTDSALRKVRPKPRHLRFAQPIKIAHDIPSKLGARITQSHQAQ